MTNLKITEEEAALRRISIVRNKHRQYVYVRKWLKKAYTINKSDFRLIGYYQNRLFLVLLSFIFMTVALNSLWPWPIVTALLVWIATEVFFYFGVIKKLSVTKMPESVDIGFVQSALLENYKITNIKIGSYLGLGIVGVISAVAGGYQGFYFAGMMGIAVFGFAQAIFHVYIQILRKKGTHK